MLTVCSEKLKSLKENDPSDENTKEEVAVVERFADDQERVDVYAQWQKQRAEWVVQQEKIHSVRELFKQFYEVRNLLIKEPDTYEFMVGNGVLEDRQQSSIINIFYIRWIAYMRLHFRQVSDVIVSGIQSVDGLTLFCYNYSIS